MKSSRLTKGSQVSFLRPSEIKIVQRALHIVQDASRKRCHLRGGGKAV
jgi:hypothetical protein